MHNPVVDLLIAILFFFTARVSSSTFTFINTCDFTVWPGVLSNAGNPQLETTGFELKKLTHLSIQAPAGWSGRFWGRTGCNDHGSESKGIYCTTGDCGSRTLGCNGNGPMIPVTLAEFSLGSGGGLDFYDVSLVDGYNLPVIVETSGGSGNCASAGCLVDINHRCPPELRSSGGGGCKSACIAFASPEYCCSGEYSTPANCRPSVYSAMFKLACPTSYSYAYDDSSSTFTCAGADYTITFCPSSTPRKRGVEEGSGENIGGGGVNGSDKSVVVGWSEAGEMSERSWMAGLAMGGVAGQFGVSGLLGWGSLFFLFFCLVW